MLNHQASSLGRTFRHAVHYSWAFLIILYLLNLLNL